MGAACEEAREKEEVLMRDWSNMFDDSEEQDRDWTEADSDYREFLKKTGLIGVRKKVR